MLENIKAKSGGSRCLRTLFLFTWLKRLSKSESDVEEGLDSFDKDIFLLDLKTCQHT